MKGQDIHNYVWNKVYYSRQMIAKNEIRLMEAKSRAVHELLVRGDITEEQKYELGNAHNCVFCVEYRCRCNKCPLRECAEDHSVYFRAMRGDAVAIGMIRNTKIYRNKHLG